MENNNFNHQEILDFKNISYKLGSDLSLVQAAGGNTSMKSNDSMLIKASGTWLSNSLKEDVFVEVDLNSIKSKKESVVYDLKSVLDINQVDARL